MLKSMTGFGRTEITLPDKKITVEIKCLNSKNADITIKMPNIYREKELEIRQLINGNLGRGKIDVTVFYELREGIAPSTINQEVVKAYYYQLKQVSDNLNLPDNFNLLDVIMRLPDTLKNEKSTLQEIEWENVMTALVQALEAVNIFRIQEGEALEKDVQSHIRNISSLLEKIGDLENVRIEKLRAKLMFQIKDITASIEIDKNRFEQELIYYIEKIDISEEKSRLKNHLNYFTETLKIEENTGKKLAFISQEIGREINTLGSKASDFDIQKIVVEMKDELEKIKEQLLNVL